jgi:hypothetical protein
VSEVIRSRISKPSHSEPSKCKKQKTNAKSGLVNDWKERLEHSGQPLAPDHGLGSLAVSPSPESVTVSSKVSASTLSSKVSASSENSGPTTLVSSDEVNSSELGGLSASEDYSDHDNSGLDSGVVNVVGALRWDSDLGRYVGSGGTALRRLAPHPVSII